MNSDSTTVRTSTATTIIRRLLAVLSIAIAMVAITGLSPSDAGAMPMSEQQASRLCRNAGGRVHFELEGDSDEFSMTCTLPSGAEFMCLSYGPVVRCL